MKRTLLALAMMLPGAAMAQEQLIPLACDTIGAVEIPASAAAAVPAGIAGRVVLRPQQRATMALTAIPCPLAGTWTNLEVVLGCTGADAKGRVGVYAVVLDRIGGRLSITRSFDGVAQPPQEAVCSRFQPVF